MSLINRRGQTGMLLEVFLLILILVLFTMFWGSYSRMTFLAGLLKIDDETYQHTCSNMVQVIIGSDYIIKVEGGEEVYDDLKAYLGFGDLRTSVPDAEFFYNKIIAHFPELQGGVGVTVTPSYPQEDFVQSAGIHVPGAIISLFFQSFKSVSCEFPLYSTDDELTAIVELEVLV